MGTKMCGCETNGQPPQQNETNIVTPIINITSNSVQKTKQITNITTFPLLNTNVNVAKVITVIIRTTLHIMIPFFKRRLYW
jgi:hypothetical protein